MSKKFNMKITGEEIYRFSRTLVMRKQWRRERGKKKYRKEMYGIHLLQSI
jgi:hypothetical protein